MNDESLKETDSDLQYASKLELVFREYERSLDLDIAMAIVPLTQEDRDRLTKDEDFLARVAVCDAKIQAGLIVDLRTLASTAVSESARLAALKELGRTVYPKRFKDTSSIGRVGRVVIVDDL